jgi:hypothetical protein
VSKVDPNEAAFRQSMAFNSDAARAGLFSAALDIADTMKENDVPHGEAAVVTGALEMAAQLWMQVMLQAGHTRMKARQAAEKQFRTFLIKHSEPRENAVSN